MQVKTKNCSNELSLQIGSSVWSLNTLQQKHCNRMHWQKLVSSQLQTVEACGYEQNDGKHYNKDEKLAPVINDMTIDIILILMIMGRLWSELMEVKGAFLLGEFIINQMILMEVLQGFKRFYPGNIVL